jgi:hypothetical protein
MPQVQGSLSADVKITRSLVSTYLYPFLTWRVIKLWDIVYILFKLLNQTNPVVKKNYKYIISWET